MNNLSFISNNVKGLQAISKRIKIFEYLKNYVISNGFIFHQETHSSIKDEKIWNDELEGQLFFSHTLNDYIHSRKFRRYSKQKCCIRW